MTMTTGNIGKALFSILRLVRVVRVEKLVGMQGSSLLVSTRHSSTGYDTASNASGSAVMLLRATLRYFSFCSHRLQRGNDFMLMPSCSSLPAMFPLAQP